MTEALENISAKFENARLYDRYRSFCDSSMHLLNIKVSTKSGHTLIA